MRSNTRVKPKRVVEVKTWQAFSAMFLPERSGFGLNELLGLSNREPSPLWPAGRETTRLPGAVKLSMDWTGGGRGHLRPKATDCTLRVQRHETITELRVPCGITNRSLAERCGCSNQRDELQDVPKKSQKPLPANLDVCLMRPNTLS